nr:thymidine phosphorylase [Salinispora arenicola]
MVDFTAVDIIRAKRDGEAFSDAQVDWVVDAYTRGQVADEQMAALAMAILLNGMTTPEIARWTAAMIASGERLDLAAVDRPTVDKHSTGGVGDKITLPLTPLVAACGAAVPQLSGRGLGHTGGTLDKLESIRGWRASLGNEEFIAQLRGVGAVICAAGAGLAPADRKLYALRDVTGTVEAIPLIASSIMSKKIAEGTGALVLDVKVGSGAFMKSVDQARQLARTMVELGSAHDVRTVALLTDMSTPLGLAIGNAVEVAESVEVLAGGGPADVVELTLALAREMLEAAGLPDADPATALRDGRAMDSWRAMLRAQGGDPDAPPAHGAGDRGGARRHRRCGGGGRRVRHGGGRVAARRRAGPQGGPGVRAGGALLLRKRPGDPVRAGDPLFELRAEDAARIPAAREEAVRAVRIAASAPEPRPLVLERIG